MISLALSSTSIAALMVGGTLFTPSALFSTNEPGVWFDPSDTSTLFQDPAGTTPVTAPGNTVGLMLDKSKGLALGAELVANGTFDANITGWTPARGDASWSAGKIRTSNNPGISSAVASSPIATVAGKTYKFSVSVGSFNVITFGRVRVATDVGLLGTELYGTASAAQNTTVTGVFVAQGATSYITVGNFGGGLTSDSWAEFDNISVRELAGNHATQATLAARPTYSVEPVGGRRNLLTWTEQFDNAVWAKDSCTVVSNTTLAPDGTTTADRIVSAAATVQIGVGQGLPTTPTAVAHTASYYVQANGARYVQLLWSTPLSTNYANFDLQNPTAPTAGTYTGATITPAANGFYRITITSTLAAAAGGTFLWFVDSGTAARAAAYTGNGTSGVFLWGAQLELGSTATAYQRVTTQHDVTEAGVASVGYLYFDGTDDCLVTGVNSSFTYTGGISLFAGFEKLGATKTFETLLAYGGGANSQSMAFLVTDDGGNRLATDIWFPSGVRGSSVLLSPSKGVATFNIQNWSTHRLSGTEIRRNGVAETVTAYGSANPTALNASTIRVGLFDQTLGSSFLFGKIYSLIARGVATDAPTIASTEVWVAGKTGFYTPIITGVPTIGVS